MITKSGAAGESQSCSDDASLTREFGTNLHEPQSYGVPLSYRYEPGNSLRTGYKNASPDCLSFCNKTSPLLSKMPDSRGPTTLVVTIVFAALSSIFVAARIYTRTVLVRKLQQDDFWILAAWIVALAFSSSICLGVAYGLGKHESDIYHVDQGPLKKAEYAFQVLYNPALMFTKTSIIVCYLSVMTTTTDLVFKWLNYITLALITVAGTALTFYNVFQCSPVSAAFSYPISEHAECTNIVTLYLSSAPVNIITDIATLLLPMPILTSIKIPKKQKIILVVTFGFGAFVTIVDVIRLAYFQNAFSARLAQVQGGRSTPQHPNEDDDDFSWYAALSFMWCAIEVNLGIVCASVPHLKPLFTKFLPRLVDDSSSRSPSVGRHSVATTAVPAYRASAFTTKSAATAWTTLASSEPFSPSTLVSIQSPWMPMSPRETLSPIPDKMRGSVSVALRPTTFGPGTSESHDRARLIRKRERSELEVPNSASHHFSVSNRVIRGDASSKHIFDYSNHESLRPVTVVTLIFFMWGVAYGLLDSINRAFQDIARLSTAQSLGLHAAYYMGYLIGPLTLGRFVLKSYGFKASMMVGLTIYGCGSLIFWPSAVLTSFTAFIFANFILAFGLSCLEIAANPYVILCGPRENGAIRLNLSQAFQAIGTVASTAIATRVLLKNSSSLVNTQWAYLGIALLAFVLAVIFYYVPLPEVSSSDLHQLAQRRHETYNVRIGRYPVIYITLAVGVFSQWCYVGVQECIGLNTIAILSTSKRGSKMTPSNFDLIALSTFATGRLAAALVNVYLRSRHLLLGLYIGLIMLLAVQSTVPHPDGVIVQILMYFVEGGIFSLIFALCMTGLGAHTMTGAAFMTSAISGGVGLPFVQWAVANDSMLRTSYCVPLAVAALGAIFPIYLNLVGAARNQVDGSSIQFRCSIAQEEQIETKTHVDTTDDTSQKAESATSDHIERRQDSDRSMIEFVAL